MWDRPSLMILQSSIKWNSSSAHWHTWHRHSWTFTFGMECLSLSEGVRAWSQFCQCCSELFVFATKKSLSVPKVCLKYRFYASAFRRRRHYVFGLSVCPSVRLSETWNNLFSHVHGSVGPSDQPWPFCGMSVRPSVRRGFRAFAGERIEGMVWNFACWCILGTFRTD